MAATHVVGISDCKLSADASDKVVTYALGSCVGVALYDSVARIGGILHIMLPDSRYRSPQRNFNPYMYADTGLYAFLHAMRNAGASQGRIGARLAGGANMLQYSQFLDIGRRNAEAAVAILGLEKIPILGTSLGGAVGRSMALSLSDGAVAVRLLGRGEEAL